MLDNSNLVFAGLWSSSVNKSINEAIKNREEFKNLKIDQLINKNDISQKLPQRNQNSLSTILIQYLQLKENLE